MESRRREDRDESEDQASSSCRVRVHTVVMVSYKLTKLNITFHNLRPKPTQRTVTIRICFHLTAALISSFLRGGGGFGLAAASCDLKKTFQLLSSDQTSCSF